MNAHTVNAQYLLNGKAYELHTLYTDGARRPSASSVTSAVTSKVKVARSRDASDRYLTISRKRNVIETPKFVESLSTPRAIMHTSFKVKDQMSRSPGRLMMRPELRHIQWLNYSGSRGPGLLKRPGGSRETLVFRGYKGACKRPPESAR